MANLNPQEKAVLAECADYNGGDFFISDDIWVEGLTAHQVAGYLSSLVKKDLIEMYLEEPGEPPMGVVTDSGWEEMERSK